VESRYPGPVGPKVGRRQADGAATSQGTRGTQRALGGTAWWQECETAWAGGADRACGAVLARATTLALAEHDEARVTAAVRGTDEGQQLAAVVWLSANRQNPG
jgi:hypothetical protein